MLLVFSTEGLGETASDIMSHDYLVNKLFFQIIGTVNFAVPSTIAVAIDELMSSGITKVLLAIQGDNVEALMKEVRCLLCSFLIHLRQSMEYF